MTTIRRVLLIAASAALVSTTPATASFERGCVTRANLPAIGNVCERTVTAAAEPVSFTALARGWHSYGTSWELADGTQFLTDARRRCVHFGRRGPLRVRESECSGRLVVTVRSVGEPVRVTFLWAGYGHA